MDTHIAQPSVSDNAPLSKKRRFAPALNLQTSSCHASHASDGHPSDGSLLQQLSGRTPSQEDIERELLQVGMRIRKSVGDGYKTAAFTPRPFFNMHRLSPATQAALCSDTMKRQPLSTATFCGVNLAALAHITSTPIEQPRVWTYSTSHKRGFEDDSDSDDQEFMPPTPMADQEQQLLTAMPAEVFEIDFCDSKDVDFSEQFDQAPTTQTCMRRMAKPKSRLQRTYVPQQRVGVNPFAQLQSTQQTSSVQWPSHRRITSCGAEANMLFGDFGEASFLQRREDIEMDCS